MFLLFDAIFFNRQPSNKNKLGKLRSNRIGLKAITFIDLNFIYNKIAAHKFCNFHLFATLDMMQCISLLFTPFLGEIIIFKKLEKYCN